MTGVLTWQQRRDRLAPQDRRGVLAIDDAAGQIGQPSPRTPGVGPKQFECLAHRNGSALGENPLSLLDDHPAVQSLLKLLIDQLGMGQAALLDDSDRGGIGKRLPYGDVGRRGGMRFGEEQAEDTDLLAVKPQWEGAG
jgi:hypothetical protein